jgi:hypothetical protein
MLRFERIPRGVHGLAQQTIAGVPSSPSRCPNRLAQRTAHTAPPRVCPAGPAHGSYCAAPRLPSRPSARLILRRPASTQPAQRTAHAVPTGVRRVGSGSAHCSSSVARRHPGWPSPAQPAAHLQHLQHPQHLLTALRPSARLSVAFNLVPSTQHLAPSTQRLARSHLVNREFQVVAFVDTGDFWVILSSTGPMHESQDFVSVKRRIQDNLLEHFGPQMV